MVSIFYGCMFTKTLRMQVSLTPLPPRGSWSTIFVFVPALISTLVSVSTATSTVNLATFTPLEDGTRTSTAFLAISTSQSGSPSTCIDACFNSATGSGKQGGCVGISGQYECICTFPAMMQTFEGCMSTTCSLDSSTVQETLGNVQQICASCTPDGCNAFSIAASGNAGGTITFQAPPGSTPSATASASFCYSTTQSVYASSVPGSFVGGGFFSAGLVPCGSSSTVGGSSTSVLVSSGSALSGSASPSGTTTTGAALSSRHHLWAWAPAFLAVAVGATLMY
ncbi:hypothetical protein B0H19DRAFT_1184064 [Mycena capillaripes]|nr:hypothetical protein B0H19DRAFT_1184064 [Mycena capillaripes]